VIKSLKDVFEVLAKNKKVSEKSAGPGTPSTKRELSMPPLTRASCRRGAAEKGRNVPKLFAGNTKINRERKTRGRRRGV